MIKIKRALVSVSDKTGILDLAKVLNKFGVEILSTGGTAKLLRENNIPVKDVSDYTGFPEILDGRVKTLHPKIHAGLLALRDNKEHMQKLSDLGMGLIDMAVINLYPFEQTVAKAGVTLEEAIENIDIGGPSMLRSAAKNHRSVAVVSSPAQYRELIRELETNGGSVSAETAKKLALEAFRLTSHYDGAIYNYLAKNGTDAQDFPEKLTFEFLKLQDLRYGENPHQKAAFYRQEGVQAGLTGLKQLQGKELSFNNILDLNSVWELLKEFDGPSAVIVKHNNPCGAAEAKNLTKAFLDAYKCDSLSAFGGIVGLNRDVDLKTASAIKKSGFLECIIAPGFSKEALAVFAKRKNLRVLELKELSKLKEYDLKRISGGLLLQEKDNLCLDENNLTTVTVKKPTKAQMESLLFAWKVAKHVKSNAIVISKGRRTVGIGAGQMSRVDSAIIARRKSGKLSRNSCLASDGFFPKPDSIAQAAACGVKAIIQPGGSIADQEVIKACDKYKIAMVTTGLRHFKH
ncbi:MAG: bifunctional phosphoribosylaminoimidazolecarboxamide formyltransferase/IMP cyclohydrolase [Candidatus Omnitrophica bacterium]|nr:bifunctional phosphoribosylaminoimidazolecarboxamide formyltransferase/IMP cyclohydrolase [Candidatus Omnitrophota bacterium]